jgi:hypothetical protein
MVQDPSAQTCQVVAVRFRLDQQAVQVGVHFICLKKKKNKEGF